MARDIEVRLFSGAAPATPLVTAAGAAGILTTDTARQWHHPLNDVGAGSFQLHADDPDAALCMGGDIARFYLNGTARFAVVLQRPSRATIVRGGNVDRARKTLQARGLGILSLWDRAVVLPENGVGRISLNSETRRFDWTSKDFDDSGWGTAVQIAQKNSGSSPWGQRKPVGFNDRTAYWIWGQAAGGGSPPQPVGFCLFRQTFTTADEGDVIIEMSGDDNYEVIVDGMQIAAEQGEFLWKKARTFSVFLDAGTHQIAVKATNADRPSSPATNIAGVILAVWSTTNGGDYDSVLVHTDDTWAALNYPAETPTMTPGEVLRIFMEEAQAEGWLPGLTLSCTDTLDSNGNAWTAGVDLAVPVGTSGLNLIKTLVEQAIDVDMNPATLELDVYNWGAFGTDLTGSISLTDGVNFGADGAGHDGEDAQANVALVKDANGRWYLIDDAGSVAAHGARVVYLSAGSAPSLFQADRSAQAMFRNYAEPQDAITGQVERRSAGEDPYTDWTVGDTILMPGIDDVAADTLILSLTVGDDRAGKATFRFEGSQEPEAIEG